MKQRQEADTVVLLADADRATSDAQLQRSPERSLACYSSVEDLMRSQPLSSIGTLVMHSRLHPSGRLLLALARVNHEYPSMRKVAVMDQPPPLRIANYLTACGVDLVWPEPGETGSARLASVLDRAGKRTKGA